MSHLFLVNNMIDEAELSLLVGTASSQYPLENIQDTFTTKKCRVLANNCELLIDTGNISPKDSVMLVGSSVDGLGFTTVTLYSSATLDFTGATVIPLNISHEFNQAWRTFTPTNNRYFKLEFLSTGGYTEVSNIFLGAATILEENGLSSESFKFGHITNADVSVNNYGNRFVNIYNRLQSLSGEFKVLNDDERITLEQIAADKGKHKPIMLVIDPDNNLGADSKFRYSGYFYIDNDLEFTSINGLFFNCAIKLTQVG